MHPWYDDCDATPQHCDYYQYSAIDYIIKLVSLPWCFLSTLFNAYDLWCIWIENAHKGCSCVDSRHDKWLGFTYMKYIFHIEATEWTCHSDPLTEMCSNVYNNIKSFKDYKSLQAYAGTAFEVMRQTSMVWCQGWCVAVSEPPFWYVLAQNN